MDGEGAGADPPRWMRTASESVVPPPFALSSSKGAVPHGAVPFGRLRASWLTANGCGAGVLSPALAHAVMQRITARLPLTVR